MLDQEKSSSKCLEECNTCMMEGSRAMCCESTALAAALYELKKEIPIIRNYAKPPICPWHLQKEDNMRKIIAKKTLPQYFDAVIKGNKNFEFRKDEDDIQVGDAVVLKEWDGMNYTGRETGRNVTYVLRNAKEFGLPDGYCIFGW